MSTQYVIMGRYQGNKEEIDEFDNREEAEDNATEYRMAFGTAWTIWISARPGTKESADK